MLGLLPPMHIYPLSDEAICKRWVDDPCFQFFTGENFFQHQLRNGRSGLAPWRQRLGEELELLLAEILRVAHNAGALQIRHLERISVDSTVQPKKVTHPTNARAM